MLNNPDMNDQQRVRRRRAIVSVLVMTFACTTLMAGISYFSSNKTAELAGWVVHTHEVRENIDKINLDIETAESSQRGYILTSSPGYLNLYNASIASTWDAMDRFQKMTLDNRAQQANCVELRRLLDARIILLNKNIGITQKYGMVVAASRVKTGKGYQAMADIRSSLSSCQAIEDDLLMKRTKAVKYEAQRSRSIILAGMYIVGILIFIAVGFAINPSRIVVRRAC